MQSRDVCRDKHVIASFPLHGFHGCAYLCVPVRTAGRFASCCAFRCVPKRTGVCNCAFVRTSNTADWSATATPNPKLPTCGQTGSMGCGGGWTGARYTPFFKVCDPLTYFPLRGKVRVGAAAGHRRRCPPDGWHGGDTSRRASRRVTAPPARPSVLGFGRRAQRDASPGFGCAVASWLCRFWRCRS